MRISTFLQTYERGTLQITDKIKYDVREVIERNNRLKHGKFENPEFPDGTAKLFYNVAFAVANTIFRNTDLDTKNMNVVSTNGVGAALMPMLKMVLRWFLKVAGYNEIINDVRQEMIDMGHVVTKIVKGKTKIVNLLNLVVPPHADSIQDAGCVEATFLTYDDMLANKSYWEDKWDAIEDLYKTMCESGEVFFTVYEQWTWGYLDDDYEGGKAMGAYDDKKRDYQENKLKAGAKIKKICIKYLDMSLISDPKTSNRNNPVTWAAYEELERFETPEEITDELTDEKIKVFPYEEQRFIKIKGRWLGFGVYELLAGLQEDYNERMNLKRRLDRQSLTGILIHRLPSDVNKAAQLTQQFIASVDQGAVLDVESDEDLDRLPAGTIADFVPMIDKIFEIMRLIIGVSAQGAGEELPASMPATTSVINQRVAQTTYDVVIEQQSIFWTKAFNKFLLRDIIESLTKKKVIAITGDPSIIDDLDQMYSSNLLNAKIQEFQDFYGQPGVVYKGREIYFSTDDPKMYEQQYGEVLEQLIEDLRSQGDSRFTSLKITGMRESIIKDIQFGVQFYVDSEAFDKRATVTDLLALRQIPDLSLSKIKMDEYLLDLSSGMDAKRFQKSKKEKEDELQRMQEVAMAENAGGVGNMVMPEGQPNATPGQAFAAANKVQSGVQGGGIVGG